ncbi:unnamed protein product [Effrenium voratum]|nr:unnamed protein product [Effrenium voratum]
MAPPAGSRLCRPCRLWRCLVVLPAVSAAFVAGLPCPRSPRASRASPARRAEPELGLDLAPVLGAVAAAALAFKSFQDWRRNSLKEELLAAVAGSQRGADGSKTEEVQSLFSQLEQLNPTGEPLASSSLRGDWELLWTTSDSILGLGRPPFFRPMQDKPILQFLDPEAGVARNLEFTPLGCNRVDASIVPLGPEQRDAFVSRLDDFLLFKQGAEEKPGGSYLPEDQSLEKTTVGVRFKTFTLFGVLPVSAPDSATGILQVTYLDDDLRLSRGDRGNLFVLKKVSAEMSA